MLPFTGDVMAGTCGVYRAVFPLLFVGDLPYCCTLSV
jgi:hypothetical protein